MSKIGIFMANGCEEIEGLTVVDIARRAGVEIEMISINTSKEVMGSHNVTFFADKVIKEVDFEHLDGIVLPGGMPGTLNLGGDENVTHIIRDFARQRKLVAAICAAPSVLGENHILDGKCATCHPGFEEKLLGAKFVESSVVIDGNIITSRGMGTAIDFALAIVRYFTDDETVSRVKAGLVYA